MSKELDTCRSERDQYKLMAEQLRDKYNALKRRMEGWCPENSGPSWETGQGYTASKDHGLIQLLCEVKEENKVLQMEVDGLRQKLEDAQGDIKLLREQIVRQRIGSEDEGVNTRHFPAHEREHLVSQLECLREKHSTLERDLQQVLDEKEESVNERDVFKQKVARLNRELTFVLRGDERRIVDIDALTMENRYMEQQVNQLKEEKHQAITNAAKYKQALEKRSNKGILKIGTASNRSGGVVISQKKVEEILSEIGPNLAAGPNLTNAATISDLKSLAVALYENLNDKTVALSHQRKTNKLLGGRVSELEKKLKTLEIAGFWMVPGRQLDQEQLMEDRNPTLSPGLAQATTSDTELRPVSTGFGVGDNGPMGSLGEGDSGPLRSLDDGQGPEQVDHQEPISCSGLCGDVSDQKVDMERKERIIDTELDFLPTRDGICASASSSSTLDTSASPTVSLRDGTPDDETEEHHSTTEDDSGIAASLVESPEKSREAAECDEAADEENVKKFLRDGDWKPQDAFLAIP